MSVFVSADRRDDGVTVVSLNRPKLNAMSRALLAELHEVAIDLRQSPPGAVVIWGGSRCFAAGAEISEFGGTSEAQEIGRLFRDALDAIAAIPRFVIAAITGYALGGGCELAMACDWRIAADDARLGQPEVLLGIIPGGGATQRLPRLVGAPLAKELMTTGRQVGAEEALRIGLVDEIVPADEVLRHAVAKASSIATGAVLAHGFIKEAVDGAAQVPLGSGLDLESDLFARIFDTEDATIGVKAFLDHGPGRASFSGK